MTTLVIILTVIVLLLIIAAFSSKEMNIEKSIVINKPLQTVFDYVKYVKNHENFSVWAMMDPEMKKQYSGTDGEPGFVFAWDSIKKKNVGAGEQEIKQVIPFKSIEHELRFIRPMQDIAKAKFVFDSVTANETKLVWGFYSKMKFPMNIMKPMIQNMLGKNLEKGLQNLKAVLEK